MDNFMSRSLDEVSWQNTLGSFYNTLGNYPIGNSPNTAINYDQSQISGAQSATTTLGQTGTGQTGGGGIQMDATAGQITLNNGGLSINSTNNGNSIDASSGVITYKGNNGSTAVQEGILTDGMVGIEINDSNNVLVSQYGQLPKNQGVGLAILNSNSTIIAQFGKLSDGTVGIQFNNSTTGNKLFELGNATWFWYDATGNNIMQVGLLPDGSYGWAVSTPGNSVASGFS